MLRIVAATIGSVVASAGCAPKPHPPLAAASRIAYTDAQRIESRAAMQSALVGVTNTGTAISLLPAEGIRWSDLSQAISEAGASAGVEAAIASSSKIGVTTRFELLTIEGWPGVLQASKQGKGIVLGASIGPYPDQPSARARAARLVELTHERLLALGRIQQVEPYNLDTYGAR